MRQAFLTAAITLLGAVILFAVSEFSRGLFIGPILGIRELVGDIVDRVIYYSADLTSGAKISPQREKKIREELRALGTQLRAKEQMLPAYRFWTQLKLVPSSNAIDICAKQLVGLSNSFSWETQIYPPRSYVANYEDNIRRIIELQKTYILTRIRTPFSFLSFLENTSLGV